MSVTDCFIHPTWHRIFRDLGLLKQKGMAAERSKENEWVPKHISPMLCTLVREPLDRKEYLYEIKWDGYRIITYSVNGKIKMSSRSGLDYTSKYPLIAEAVANLRHDVILDGEVVVFNAEDKPDFDALQKYNGVRSPITYCVFDILFMDGHNLMEMPLEERKEILRTLVKGKGNFMFSESFGDGPALYNKMLEENLEGIVAKKRNSTYQPAQRNGDWVKTPTRKRQEFVIGGWAESDKSRAFKSLLFGAYENGKLQWIGRSGGGYKEKEMPAILNQLEKLETKTSPFANKVLDTKGAKIHWMKPELVANFEFATWTKSGRIRKPATFLGFRKDKNPKDVVREIPRELAEQNTGVIIKKEQEKKKQYLNEGSNWEKVDELLQDSDTTKYEMENCAVVLHDVDRELWTGVPKGKLIIYYNELSEYILPYLKGRPQSLNLKLAAAGGPTTFIKDMEGREPECATVFIDQRRVPKKGKRNQIDYLVCNNTETLLFMVDWGCVDINPWSSRTVSPNKPDFLWIDLDPTVEGIDDDSGFAKAVEVALAVREVLSRHKVISFIKTSGKTGLHVYIPVTGIDFTMCRTLANRIADQVHSLVGTASTRQESISMRGDRVYIDANQNDYADTLAAPYSIRPYHQPLVSTPLEWKEVKASLDRYAYNIDSIVTRLNKKGDLFSGVLDQKTAKNNTSKLLKLFS